MGIMVALFCLPWVNLLFEEKKRKSYDSMLKTDA